MINGTKVTETLALFNAFQAITAGKPMNSGYKSVNSETKKDSIGRALLIFFKSRAFKTKKQSFAATKSQLATSNK